MGEFNQEKLSAILADNVEITKSHLSKWKRVLLTYL